MSNQLDWTRLPFSTIIVLVQLLQRVVIWNVNVYSLCFEEGAESVWPTSNQVFCGVIGRSITWQAFLVIQFGWQMTPSCTGMTLAHASRNSGQCEPVSRSIYGPNWESNPSFPMVGYSQINQYLPEASSRRHSAPKWSAGTSSQGRCSRRSSNARATRTAQS